MKRSQTRRRAALALLVLAVDVVGMPTAIVAKAAPPLVTLSAVSTGFPYPIGLDYYQPTNQVIMSVNYSSGLPNNFRLVASDGTQSQFSTVAGLTNEVYMVAIRSSSCQGGFTPGDVYVGTGTPGDIAKITDGGATLINPWVSLPGEGGLLRGGIAQDVNCVAGGDIIATTTAGDVWRVTSAGAATEIATGVGDWLEGPTTLPNSNRYGPWAGKILAASESCGCVRSVDPNTGAVSTWGLGQGNMTGSGVGSAEGIHVVPLNENFYGVDFGSGTLQGASYTQFSGIVGDIVVPTEFPGRLVDVTWNATTSSFDSQDLLTVNAGQWEGTTFAPAGIPPIPPAPPPVPAPNPPQNVTNSDNSAGQVVVQWQPPVPNGATVDHYNVFDLASGALAATVPATVTSLSASITQVRLCTYYRFGVTAVGVDGQQSTVALPPKAAFTQGSPKSPPTTVAILVAGINTSSGAGTFNPLNVYDYCTTVDGMNPISQSVVEPAPLAAMNHEWNVEDDPAHSPKFGAGNRMIDTIASTGAIVLPFSYTGAILSGPASAPTFNYQAYKASKVAVTRPDHAAKTLDAEISSINQVWPNAHIVVIGHSNGGLVAEQWWLLYGSNNRHGVDQVFALDSPLNGTLNPFCAISALCGTPHVLGVGKKLADFYLQLWIDQSTNDPRYVALDAKNDLFTPIGTYGDPVYDPPDSPLGFKVGHFGLVSQLYYSEPSCADSIFDLSSPSCSLVGKDFVDPCGPLDDGSPPFFGVPGSLWLHSVVKNCPGVIAKVMTYVS
jgi:hypothetical protein